MTRAIAILLAGASLILVAYAQSAHAAPPAHAVAPQAKATGSILVGGKPIIINQTYANQLKHLRKLGVPLCFPTFLPTRFAMSLVKLDTDGDNQNPDYKIEFRDKDKHCLAVESAYSGIGDGPDGDRQLKGSSNVFGDFRIDVFKPGSEGNCTKQIYYLSSWLLDKKFRDALEKDTRNLPKGGRFYHIYGEGITDKEAVEIVQSLMPVSDVR